MVNTDPAFHKLERQRKLISLILKCVSVATAMDWHTAVTDHSSIAGQIPALESVQSAKVAESPHNAPFAFKGTDAFVRQNGLLDCVLRGQSCHL